MAFPYPRTDSSVYLAQVVSTASLKGIVAVFRLANAARTTAWNAHQIPLASNAERGTAFRNSAAKFIVFCATTTQRPVGSTGLLQALAIMIVMEKWLAQKLTLFACPLI